MLARTWVPKPPKSTSLQQDETTQLSVVTNNRSQMQFDKDVRDEMGRLEIEFDKKLREMQQQGDRPVVESLPAIEPPKYKVDPSSQQPLRSPRWDGMVFVDGSDREQRLEKQMKYRLQLDDQQKIKDNSNVSPIQLQQMSHVNDTASVGAVLQNNSLQIGKMRVSTAEMKEAKRRRQLLYMNQLQLDVNTEPLNSPKFERNKKSNDEVAANSTLQMDIQELIDLSIHGSSNGYYSNIEGVPMLPHQPERTQVEPLETIDTRPGYSSNQASSLVGSPLRNEARKRLVRDIYSAHPLIQGNESENSNKNNKNGVNNDNNFNSFSSNDHQFVEAWKPSGRNKTFKEVNSVIEQKRALEMQILETRRRKEGERVQMRLLEEAEDRRVRAELESLSSNIDDAHVVNNIKGSVAVEIKSPKRAFNVNNGNREVDEITRLQDIQTRAALVRRGKKNLADKLQTPDLHLNHSDNNNSVSHFEVSNNSMMRNANRNKNLNPSEGSPLDFTNKYKRQQQQQYGQQQQQYGQQREQQVASPQKHHLSHMQMEANTSAANQQHRNNNNNNNSFERLPKIHVLPNNFIEQHVSYDIATYNRILSNLRPDSAEEVDSFLVNWQRQVHESAFNYNVNKLLVPYVYSNNPSGPNPSYNIPKNSSGWFVDSTENMLKEQKSRFLKADANKNGGFGNDSTYFLNQFREVYGMPSMEESLRSESNWLEFTEATPVDTPSESIKGTIAANSPPDASSAARMPDAAFKSNSFQRSGVTYGVGTGAEEVSKEVSKEVNM